MNYNYVSEKNHLLLLALLKAYGIRKVIASPGATNITLVASMQSDSYFELYSCVDERSAAYMACGLCEASGEPVVISCTGATSAREYMPALTEAYYRKLPVLAITSTQDISRVGHLIAQVTDRSVRPNDIVMESVHLQTVKDKNDEWDCTIKINKALQALTCHGGGPVHINLTTTYSRDFTVKELPQAVKIGHYTCMEELPALPEGRIAVFIGAHNIWTNQATQVLDDFCNSHDAVVFCDHCSNYRGKYRVLNSLIGLQTAYHSPLLDVDLLIHIGEVSGAYDAFTFCPKQVWRVSLDGKIRDQFKKLTAVFEMSEEYFFSKYITENKKDDNFYKDWQNEIENVNNLIPELPFSNIWVAQQTAPRLPQNSVLYLGILNSLRSWNYFETPSSIEEHSNTGGFGIDGIISTLIGSSFANHEKIHFAVVGDLSFFYDMNSLGNRHVMNNVRIMVINNGKGMEFRLINHNGAMFGEKTDEYIAAGGHFGNQSSQVVKNLAVNWGYEYLSASNKEEFSNAIDRFITSSLTDRPMVFEVFTDTEGETTALKMMEELIVDNKILLKSKAKEVAKSIIGERGKKMIKSFLK